MAGVASNAVRSVLVALFSAWLLPASVAACPGDCDGDGTVRIDELIAGVGIALGQAPVETCRAADGDADGEVLIGELIAATNALLAGCPAAIATPTASPPPPPSTTATALPSRTAAVTPTASPSPTATAVPNQPPALPSPFVYRGFVGEPIARPLAAVDPDGDPLTCTAESLLAGMALGDDRVLRWTPAADQLGPLSVAVACLDDADPPLAAAGTLDFRIATADACTTPVCDPAAGCIARLPPLERTCCAGPVAERLAEAPVHCPSGRLLQIGRNTIGFGRLHNCDVLRFRQRAQSDAELRFHVRVSCVNALNRVTIGARLESPIGGVVVDAGGGVFLPAEPINGFYERRNFSLPFAIRGPFFDIENTEATLTVTATDSDGVVASETIRVILSSSPDLPDLPDL